MFEKRSKLSHLFPLLLISFTLFTGCSQKQANTLWQRTKSASYNAASDTMSWAPLAASGVLYASKKDGSATKYFMDKHLLNDDKDDIYRKLNYSLTFTTALLAEDGEWKRKLKRLVVELGVFGLSKESVDILNEKMDIGSHHTLSPFAGSAMTRRNVSQMNIPEWSRYAINSSSYLSATGSTLIRIQEGGHTVADQLISVSLGNFLGLFFHDLFMMKEDESLNISLSKDDLQLGMNFRF